MDTAELFQRLGLALAIGLLIGLERGWRERDAESGSRTAGIRTFTLIGLLGGIWGAMTPVLGPVPLAAAAVRVRRSLSRSSSGARRRPRASSPSPARSPAISSFALGAYAVLGDQAVAAALRRDRGGAACRAHADAPVSRDAHLARIALGHSSARHDLRGAAVPAQSHARSVGRVQPYELWLITVVLAAISFAGYVAVRILGERWGLLVATVAGSFVSSTTVTVTNARLAAQSDPRNYPFLALTICIAWITSIFAHDARSRSGSTARCSSRCFCRCLAANRRARDSRRSISIGDRRPITTGAEQTFSNPLDLKFVLSLGALIAVIAVAAKVGERIPRAGGAARRRGPVRVCRCRSGDRVLGAACRYIDHARSGRTGDSACSGREFGDQDEPRSGSAAGGSPLP